MYYNARYYDPALGAFVSPDSMVPVAGQVINYNRFLYARGNPLKYTDPTGHAGYDPTGLAWVQEFKDNHQGRAPTPRDRFYRSVSLTMRGPASGSRTWTDRDWKQNAITPVLTPAEVRDLAGIIVDSSWKPNHDADLDLLTEGVLKFGEELGKLVGGDVRKGLVHLKKKIGGGVIWYRASEGTNLCKAGLACALEAGKIGFYDDLFDEDPSTIRGAAVHELAHKIHFEACTDPARWAFCIQGWTGIGLPGWFEGHHLTVNGAKYPWEYWAEMVTDWVYGSDYLGSQGGRQNIENNAPLLQGDYIKGILKK